MTVFIAPPVLVSAAGMVIDQTPVSFYRLGFTRFAFVDPQDVRADLGWL
jgi:hypothetical protein